MTKGGVEACCKRPQLGVHNWTCNLGEMFDQSLRTNHDGSYAESVGSPIRIERENTMATKDVAEQFVQRLGVGDAEGLGALFTESIDWRVPGNEKLPWTGTRSQRSDVPEYFRTLWTGLEAGKSIVDFDTILVDGNDAVLLAHFSHVAAPTGKPFDTDVAMRLTVNGDKITRLHLYEDTLAVAKAFEQ